MTNNGSDALADVQRTLSELQRQIDAVRSIAVALSTTTKADQVIRQALDTSLSLAGADAGSIILYNAEKDKLVFEYVVGEKAGELTGMEIDPSQGIAGKVFHDGQTSVSDDVNKDESFSREVGDRVGYSTSNMITVPLRSPEDKPFGVMQVLNKHEEAFDSYDVSLIEIMAAQVAVAIETARLHEQARLAEVMRFIGNISHDVKNMMTPTVTGAETLRMIADDCFQRVDDDVLCGLHDSKKQVDTMGELRSIYPEIIEMILEGCNAVQQRMAEISSAVKGIVSEPQFEPADVAAISRRVNSMISPVAQKKGVQIGTQAQDSLSPAVVDGKQIYNALYNLMFNAVDACADGDSVTLHIGERLDGTFPDGNYVLIECRDTGPGIPEHVLATLFTDKAISTKPMGTGLGTRIIKNVVDAHGGVLEVESQLGIGTCIRCKVPASR